MDGQTCDRHPSALAQAKVTLPSNGILYVCGHCANTLDFGTHFYIEYEALSLAPG
ncbi:hypothetical protein [Arthrobacter sp. C152]